MTRLQSVTADELTEWNRRYASLPALDIVQLSSRWFSPNLVLASSFGPEDLVLMHLALQQDQRPEIFVLDTGRLPPETYDLIERWRLRYEVKFRFYYPDPVALESFVTTHGPNAFYESAERRKQCCQIRKVQPLQRALQGKDAWLTGLRREQSAARSTIDLFAFDEAGRLKISPLIDWSRQEVWDYIRTHKLPYNPLHDKGYASIGCAPCSRAIEAHEDERAGRWWWEDQSHKECGLHSPVKKEDQHAPASL
ncbi:MAG TPA: phosphoadenylyl-sulfate reductase [Oligoflexus sp.]|uniref:phosphoadenylyl-sulfate reductase n=1 Tax=Oligoflexus sp. TaxID=1971216 RepID=UPI002D32DD56|nr:phosphoadenylyl-sulfate reductase [Oligoflexus sp.]HYX31690.1 phosphoadenylyl-sulfate reductase [Oligoflexus sp.]